MEGQGREASYTGERGDSSGGGMSSRSSSCQQRWWEMLLNKQQGLHICLSLYHHLCCSSLRRGRTPMTTRDQHLLGQDIPANCCGQLTPSCPSFSLPLAALQWLLPLLLAVHPLLPAFLQLPSPCLQWSCSCSSHAQWHQWSCCWDHCLADCNLRMRLTNCTWWYAGCNITMTSSPSSFPTFIVVLPMQLLLSKGRTGCAWVVPITWWQQLITGSLSLSPRLQWLATTPFLSFPYFYWLIIVFAVIILAYVIVTVACFHFLHFLQPRL